MTMRFKLIREPINLELNGKDEKEIIGKLKDFLEKDYPTVNVNLSDCKILVERPEYETY